MSVTSRKTICFVISDFMDDGFIQSMRSANRKHDVIAVMVSDPKERSIPRVGLVTLEDPETGQVRDYDTGSAEFRKHVEQASQDRIDELKRTFGSSGIDFIEVDSQGDVVDPLVKFFRMRQKRQRA